MNFHGTKKIVTFGFPWSMGAEPKNCFEILGLEEGLKFC